MNLLCKLGIHDWGICTCRKCDKARFGGHDWVGRICVNCFRKREWVEAIDTVEFECEKCGQCLSADEYISGLSFICPRCKTTLRAPDAIASNVPANRKQWLSESITGEKAQYIASKISKALRSLSIYSFSLPFGISYSIPCHNSDYTVLFATELIVNNYIILGVDPHEFNFNRILRRPNPSAGHGGLIISSTEFNKDYITFILQYCVRGYYNSDNTVRHSILRLGDDVYYIKKATEDGDEGRTNYI